MTKYKATYTHDGHWWIVQFDDPDISTFGRTLAAAKGYARSMLALYLDIKDLAAAGIEIEEDVQLPAPLEVEVERLARRRKEADALRSAVAEETRAAAADLRRAGLSTRDVGEILGISGARVAQIEREAVPVSSPERAR